MILNIIEKIYGNSNFKKYLIIAFIILVLLLVIVYIIGKLEYKKKNAPKKDPEDDLKDITFDLPLEATNINEDVTFEMPVLTRNLEEFKKSLEEEIEKEEEIAVRKTSGTKIERETKAIKILDKDVIDDTAIVPLKNIEIAKKEEEKISKPILYKKVEEVKKKVEVKDYKEPEPTFIPPKKATMILETIEIPELASVKRKSPKPVLEIINTEPIILPKKAVPSSNTIYDTSDDF